MVFGKVYLKITRKKKRSSSRSLNFDVKRLDIGVYRKFYREKL